MSDRFYRDAYVKVDLDRIGQNYEALSNLNDKKFIAVVKSNAYGHGSTTVANYLQSKGVDFFAVGTLDEAIELRMHGIKSKILVLGIINPKNINKAIQHRVAITAPSKDWLVDALNHVTGEYEKEVWIHIKVNSHMNRYGTNNLEEIKEMIQLIEESNFFVYEGIFSHYASASSDLEKAQDEFNVFREIVKAVKIPPYVHMSNSAGALAIDEGLTNAVRVGISLYGYYPSDYIKERTSVELKPALDLVCRVVDTHELKENETVGYDETFIADSDLNIVTIPIGYGDGLLRDHQGYKVGINGESCEIIGRVCMDAAMIKSNAKLGDEVIVISSEQDSSQSLEAYSRYVDSITYESICLLSRRLPRIYKQESNEVIFNEILK